MKTAVIISGGNLNQSFALAFLEKTKHEILIGADKGICFLKEAGWKPTHIVGDFDSAAGEALEYFRQFPEIPIRQFNPEKDLTDTQIALELAIELSAEQIYILGCSGTRLDHVLANIKILSIALEKGVKAYLLDEHNRIRLAKDTVRITKQEQYGKYISIFAFGENVKGITLKGFYYLLTKYDMNAGDPLGVSNEITAEIGEIFFDSGRLLIFESKD